MPDFRALLDRKVGTAKPPEFLPAGLYHCVVQRMSPAEKLPFEGKEKVPCYCLHILVTGATEDVDPDSLLDEEGKQKDLAKISRGIRTLDFFIPDDEFRLKAVLETFGIQDLDEKSWAQSLQEIYNVPALVDITAKARDSVTYNGFRSLRAA